MFNNHFKFNLKSLFLITMVVFCAGAGCFLLFNSNEVKQKVSNIDVNLSTQQAKAAAIFSNVEIIARKDTSVVVQWDTPDGAATGQIEYGLTTSYGNLTSEQGLSYWHPMEVTGLAEGTTYHYRIRAKDYKGVETISGGYTFTTRTTAELGNIIRAARIGGDLPKTYYVSPSGNNSNDGLSLETPWATPYYAAQVAEAGDTILVAEGTYTGYVSFGFYSTDTHHNGIPEAPVTMKAYSGTPEIVGQVSIKNKYITFDGFVCHDASGFGIDVRGSTGIKILNCEVYNTPGSDGIYFRDVTYSLIENCTVHDTGWNGIGIKPSSTWPFSGHHVMVRNCTAYDNMWHNQFDVKGDYLTLENCYTNIYREPVGDEHRLAPYRIRANHAVMNNCTGLNGNNGIHFTGDLTANSIVVNCTFDKTIKTSGGDSNDIIIYNNHLTYSDFAIDLKTTTNILIEENEIYCDEIYGYTYCFYGGNITIRNEEKSPYRARSNDGANITIEYTDGRIFSVDGSGEYTTYTFSSGTRKIEVVGWSSVGNISGTVTDAETESGIEAATVSVEGTGKSAETSADGTYTIANVPIGTYNVTCTATIYQDATQSNVVANEDQMTIVDFDVTKETTPPEITTHSPTGSDVFVETSISVTFSEEMNKSSAEDAFSISSSVNGSFSWDGNKMIFTPDSDLNYWTTYAVNISAEAEDLAGNNLLSPYGWQFTTMKQDLTLPVLSDVNATSTGSSATITWQTDELANSLVKYGTSPDSYTQTKNDSSYVTSHSITLAGLSPNTTYYFVVNSIYQSGNSNQSTEYNFTTTEETNLTGLWHFDEGSGTIANDSSGYGNDGTLTNMDSATDWVDGKIGGALDFDGVDDYVEVPNFNTPDSFSIVMWVYINELNRKQYLTEKEASSSPYEGTVSFTVGNEFSLQLYDTTFAPVIISDSTYGTGWFHIVAVRDIASDKLYLYINGVSAATPVTDTTTGAITNNKPRRFGAGNRNPAGRYFNGTIDEVRIYNRALTAEEVLAHYNEGNESEPEINHDPIGTLDSANQTQITGWAYDLNAGTNPINVHIYIDGNPIENIIANLNRPDIIGAGDGQVQDPNHGFTFSTPTDLSVGEHTVNVYAINQPEGTNPELVGSPITFTVLPSDTIPPVITAISSQPTANSALINFQTNEPSYSHIEYGTSVAYGFQLPANSELKTDYSISIISLGSDTEYHFRVVTKDALENESNSIDQTFKTIGNPDTIPPAKITDLSSSNITQTSADLRWTSPGDDHNIGTASTYDIRYSTSNITESNWNSATQISGEPIPQTTGTEQSIYIAVGLSSNTSYYFAIKSADEVPNWSDYSNILSLKTLEETTTPPGGGGTISDTTPPNQPSSFKAIPADSQITLNWKNPNDSDFVRIKLLRKENSSPTSHNDSLAKIIYEGVAEQYTDINLNNNTTYYYSIFAYDKKPNYSKILTISSKPEQGKTSIEISNETYPEATLLKTPDSFKIYIIINQKKKWIPTPEVFETLGYQWTNITIIDKNQLTLIPDFEDNLIRALNDFKVYLIVNGIKRHLPNPEIFLNYGFAWNEVKDVNQETINQYTQCNLIKESKKEEVYYLCPTRKIKRWLRSPEIFNSYPDNNWNNIQVISKYEMDHYPTSNLIKLNNDNDVYLIEGNKKRLINSAEEFEREGLDWGRVMGVGEREWEWFGG